MMFARKNSEINFKKGQAIITAVIFFLFVSMTTILGVTAPVYKEVQLANDINKSKESFYLSESGQEDAVYRLKNGISISNTEVLTLGSSTVSTIIQDNSGMKVITSTATSSSLVRRIETELQMGQGVAFNYGIQTGQGGFNLSGGATVNGNVYANGNIEATNGVVITGSAVAANLASSLSDQSNNLPIPTPNSINFRDTSGTQDLAQSFIPATTSQITSLKLYIKKTGTPTDATVRIVANSNGNPSSSTLTSGTLSSNLVTTSYGWVETLFPSGVNLTAGTTYWIVIDNSTQNSSRYYTIGANDTYAGGLAKVGQFNGTWNNTTPSGLDMYFTTTMGGEFSFIGGDSYVGGVTIGSLGVGDAWGHTVEGASVAGGLYCQTGLNNNKNCDTSREDPPPQNLPVSDANIEVWKSEALAGGVLNGDQTIGWQGGTLGPVKINGDLNINGGGTLTMTGTVWVTGEITVSGGGKVRLSSSYEENSGVLLSDDRISLSGGGALSGSGEEGSYLMILTTYSSDCENGECSGNSAISLSGGAGAVILNAQKGFIDIQGGADINSAAAYEIRASGGAIINYEQGLANPNFTSGPSGGYSINSWKEVE
jgi:hypothetical protein